MDPAVKDHLIDRLTDLFGPGWGWNLEEVHYDVSSPTTAGLFRVRFDGQRDPVFVKVLSSYHQWPMLDLLTDEFRELATSTDLWRYEADVYLDGLAYSLPSGLRLPKLHSVEMLDDDHLVMFLEDVQPAADDWDHERYGRAAELLGKLSARLTRNDALLAAAIRTPGKLTRLMHAGFVERFAIRPLLDESVWDHPLLAGSGLRQELAGLVSGLPALLDDLAQRPQLMSHGDACPQNLLIPADDPDGFVAIDWTLSGLVAAGDDLGQLLIGRAHSGQLGVEELAELRELVVERYHAGLVSEGRANVGVDDVRAGLDGSLVLRNAFLSVPLGILAEPVTDESAAFMSQRLELTRYLVELGAVSLSG
ncbi:hypothetical protein GCM10009789_79770 [Kribbella sancticallisti]|uniref:FHA domain-containing protein n=1 Tax=Kribbella sancticallisti TaxID=460087 RepID=A0ABN2ES23_9ACTN